MILGGHCLIESKSKIGLTMERISILSEMFFKNNVNLLRPDKSILYNAETNVGTFSDSAN